jgi:microcystin-dependent protein
MQVNIPGGLPQLDMDGSIPPEFLPYETMTYCGTFGSAASTTGGDLPASGALDGDVYVCAAAEYYSQVAQASFIAGQQAIYSGSAWDAVPVAATVGDSVPVGGILPYAGSAASIPPNYLPCNGYILSRETYFLLFSAIGTAYNTGAESSAQFSIPNYNGEGRFLQGGVEAGARVAPGLPDITGTIGVDLAATYSGAFTLGGAPSQGAAGGSSNNKFLHFKASSSNAIYGASATVQPPAQLVLFLIRYQ